MFIKKDPRKIMEILFDEHDDRARLLLARREAEFATAGAGGAGTGALLSAAHAPRLEKTKMLSLYNNKLERLDSVRAVAAHGVLESLDLGCNQLSALPASFAELERSLKRALSNSSPARCAASKAPR